MDDHLSTLPLELLDPIIESLDLLAISRLSQVSSSFYESVWLNSRTWKRLYHQTISSRRLPQIQIIPDTDTAMYRGAYREIILRLRKQQSVGLQLIYAADNGYERLLDHLIRLITPLNTPELICELNVALMYAAWSGHHDIVDRLIASGATGYTDALSYASGATGYTDALSYAIVQEQWSIANQMIRLGAMVPMNWFLTVVSKRRLDTIHLMLDKILSMDDPEWIVELALDRATQDGHDDVVQLIRSRYVQAV
jgi:hypothetical protein